MKLFLSALAFAAALLNIVGVAALKDAPSSYRIGELDLWLQQAALHPGAVSVSSWTFALGVLAMPLFLLGFVRRAEGNAAARLGVVAVALGATLNAAGCLAVDGMVRFGSPSPDNPAARGVFAAAVNLDATFNLMLGIGLIAVQLGAPRLPRWLRTLGIAAGIASLPVTLQAFSDSFAKLLIVSGPLWLAWFIAAGIHTLRQGPPHVVSTSV